MSLADYADCIKLVWVDLADFFVNESGCTVSAYLCRTIFPRTHTHTHTYTHNTSPPRADPNFLTHFTAKGGPSLFEWSALSM